MHLLEWVRDVLAALWDFILDEIAPVLFVLTLLVAFMSAFMAFVVLVSE